MGGRDSRGQPAGKGPPSSRRLGVAGREILESSHPPSRFRESDKMSTRLTLLCAACLISSRVSSEEVPVASAGDRPQASVQPEKASEPAAKGAATEPSPSSTGSGGRARPAAGSARRRVPLKTLIRAARPWSFTATVTPVLLGTALAFKDEDKFSVLRLVLSLVTTLGVHSAGNLMNTLFDFKNGVDDAKSSDKTLVSGELGTGARRPRARPAAAHAPRGALLPTAPPPPSHPLDRQGTYPGPSDGHTRSRPSAPRHSVPSPAPASERSRRISPPGPRPRTCTLAGRGSSTRPSATC